MPPRPEGEADQMCGIAGAIHLRGEPIPDLARRLQVMNQLQAHRGPDGEGAWSHASGRVGLAHRRLSIIDLTPAGAQPMSDAAGDVITYNGEVYNYLELREQLGRDAFRTTSDTEAILAAYRAWGIECPTHLRGMFAFALWDERAQRLVLARDRFGVKPLYWTLEGDVLHFASEAKALLPFLPEARVDTRALHDYLVFQLYLEGKTLLQGVHELMPGHRLVIEDGQVKIERYWEVYYDLDWDHTRRWFVERLRGLIEDSLKVHLRADVPVGAYVSGGVDSGIVASVAARMQPDTEFLGFHGKFSRGPQYDESSYARAIAAKRGMSLKEIDLGPKEFVESIEKVIYHLDFPVAGPGSFPQYHVSKLAARHRKVVLGGQGGDEVFGGYARYLIAYFEQCIRGAIDGTMHSGNFVVTYESIIPNLQVLRGYKPLLQKFWREGLFESHDRRYFRLIDRADTLADEIRWEALGAGYDPFQTFERVFNAKNVQKESYFDSMTHFDFKTLLPGLLQVEDRMSMAHGLESRVPLLDHPIVELAATIPSNIKFQDGTLKMLLLDTMGDELPQEVLTRKDKMGFPVPLTEWLASGEVLGFVSEVFTSRSSAERPFFDREAILAGLGTEAAFGRKVWGLLCLELWFQRFVDRHGEFRRLLT